MKTNLKYLALVLLLAGCASVSHVEVALNPKANTCDVFDQQDITSALKGAVCYDQDGHAIGVIAGNSSSKLGVAATIIQPLAVVGAAGIIASQLGSINNGGNVTVHAP